MKAARRAFIFILLFAISALAQFKYQKPPKEILDVLNAPPAPQASLNPTRTHMMLIQGVRYPSIADLSQPMLRLAGFRINPRTNGPHNPPRAVALTLKKLADGAEIAIKLPPDAHLAAFRWSPDGKKFAFTNTSANTVELWVGDLSGAVHRLAGISVNAALGMGNDVFQWLPDNRTLVAVLVPAGRGKPPEESTVPVGPNVQESTGKSAPLPTFEDLLKNAHDEDLFEYYATSQLALLDCTTGKATPVGKPAIFTGVDPSPDGKLLLVERIHRPFSYLHVADMFPMEIEVWDHTAKVMYKVVSRPLEDHTPIEGVITGPRNMMWRPTEPATLYWVEALDEGNPKNKVPFRDRLVTIKAPFTAAPAEVVKTEQRLQRVAWGEKFALVGDYDRDRRWTRTFMLSLDESGAALKLLWERNEQDRY